MARLVVALVTLAVMSAGSMYWAAAQQSDPSRSSVKHSPWSGLAARALPADQDQEAKDAAASDKCAAKSEGCRCGCGCKPSGCAADSGCEGSQGCPAQGSGCK
jgi:hypothetical protein